jgi:tRNA pseudouridine38-40 synthase
MKGRYFLELAYSGSNYHGWQVQQNALSIQEVLENRIGKIVGEKVATTASGRTDTGVHALQQFVHLDMPRDFQKDDFLYRANAILPPDITIKSIFKVKEDAHARFSAHTRSYQYKLHTNKDPFLYGYSYLYPHPVRAHDMNEASVNLIGEKDFKSFSRVKTGVMHFVCNISKANWAESNGNYLFNISSNRFLRGMVRAIVGSLLEVGKGTISVQEFGEIIESKDRKKAGRAVPACGLYLSEVKYPDHIFEDYL